ncbi:MAG: hypothetical protein P857_755 [Candidatus Xenolissoclinum pacificiensis L6]|uniref:Uncharacterized protein n=1 Tax=Candidatus Xenolissoclinum pacificiensis L6 TaxID=1401685 RepID=W2UYS8_9RICK|nr:MAG: hypothetical protein P857_755 [Candidatus Xenolissoclinum pacificiensis L6]
MRDSLDLMHSICSTVVEDLDDETKLVVLFSLNRWEEIQGQH